MPCLGAFVVDQHLSYEVAVIVLCLSLLHAILILFIMVGLSGLFLHQIGFLGTYPYTSQ